MIKLFNVLSILINFANATATYDDLYKDIIQYQDLMKDYEEPYKDYYFIKQADELCTKKNIIACMELIKKDDEKIDYEKFVKRCDEGDQFYCIFKNELAVKPFLSSDSKEICLELPKSFNSEFSISTLSWFAFKCAINIGNKNDVKNEPEIELAHYFFKGKYFESLGDIGAAISNFAIACRYKNQTACDHLKENQKKEIELLKNSKINSDFEKISKKEQIIEKHFNTKINLSEKFFKTENIKKINYWTIREIISLPSEYKQNKDFLTKNIHQYHNDNLELINLDINLLFSLIKGDYNWNMYNHLTFYSRCNENIIIKFLTTINKDFEHARIPNCPNINANFISEVIRKYPLLYINLHEDLKNKANTLLYIEHASNVESKHIPITQFEDQSILEMFVKKKGYANSQSYFSNENNFFEFKDKKIAIKNLSEETKRDFEFWKKVLINTFNPLRVIPKEVLENPIFSDYLRRFKLVQHSSIYYQHKTNTLLPEQKKSYEKISGKTIDFEIMKLLASPQKIDFKTKKLSIECDKSPIVHFNDQSSQNVKNSMHLNVFNIHNEVERIIVSNSILNFYQPKWLGSLEKEKLKHGLKYFCKNQIDEVLSLFINLYHKPDPLTNYKIRPLHWNRNLTSENQKDIEKCITRKDIVRGDWVIELSTLREYCVLKSTNPDEYAIDQVKFKEFLLSPYFPIIEIQEDLSFKENMKVEKKEDISEVLEAIQQKDELRWLSMLKGPILENKEVLLQSILTFQRIPPYLSKKLIVSKEEALAIYQKVPQKLELLKSIEFKNNEEIIDFLNLIQIPPQNLPIINNTETLLYLINSNKLNRVPIIKHFIDRNYLKENLRNKSLSQLFLSSPWLLEAALEVDKNIPEDILNPIIAKYEDDMEIIKEMSQKTIENQNVQNLLKHKIPNFDFNKNDKIEQFELYVSLNKPDINYNNYGYKIVSPDQFNKILKINSIYIENLIQANISEKIFLDTLSTHPELSAKFKRNHIISIFYKNPEFVGKYFKGNLSLLPTLASLRSEDIKKSKLIENLVNNFKSSVDTCGIYTLEGNRKNFYPILSQSKYTDCQNILEKKGDLIAERALNISNSYCDGTSNKKSFYYFKSKDKLIGEIERHCKPFQLNKKNDSSCTFKLNSESFFIARSDYKRIKSKSIDECKEEFDRLTSSSAFCGEFYGNTNSKPPSFNLYYRENDSPRLLKQFQCAPPLEKLQTLSKQELETKLATLILNLKEKEYKGMNDSFIISDQKIARNYFKRNDFTVYQVNLGIKDNQFLVIQYSLDNVCNQNAKNEHYSSFPFHIRKLMEKHSTRSFNSSGYKNNVLIEGKSFFYLKESACSSTVIEVTKIMNTEDPLSLSKNKLQNCYLKWIIHNKNSEPSFFEIDSDDLNLCQQKAQEIIKNNNLPCPVSNLTSHTISPSIELIFQGDSVSLSHCRKPFSTNNINIPGCLILKKSYGSRYNDIKTSIHLNLGDYSIT